MAKRSRRSSEYDIPLEQVMRKARQLARQSRVRALRGARDVRTMMNMIRSVERLLAADKAAKPARSAPKPLLPHLVKSTYSRSGSPLASAARGIALKGSAGALKASPFAAPSAAQRAGIKAPRFSMSRITKGGPAGNVADSNARRAGTAGAHQRYIERGGTEHSADKPGRDDPTAEGFAEGYRERSGEDVLVVLGNLGPTYEHRTRVWSDIEKVEKDNPGTCLAVDTDKDRAFWDVIFAQQDLNETFAQIQRRMKSKRGRRKEWIAVTEQDIYQVVKAARHAGFDISQEAENGRPVIKMRDSDGNPVACPLRRTDGRGGTVMHKIQLGLPCEIPTDSAIQVAEEFVGEIAKLGVPVSAAVHRPPKGGDQRNIHLHIAFYDRESKLMPDGRWDFQHIADEIHDNPRRRADLGKKVRAINDRKFIPNMRQLYVDIVNRALQAHNVTSVRYTAKTYAAEGVEQENSTQPLATALHRERAGLDSISGAKKAETFADRQIREIDMRRRRRIQQARERVDRLELWSVPKSDPGFREVRELANEYLRIQRWLADYTQQQELFSLSASARDRRQVRIDRLEENLTSKTLRAGTRRKLETERAVLAHEHAADRVDLANQRAPLDRVAGDAVKMHDRAMAIEDAFSTLLPVGAAFRKFGVEDTRVLAALARLEDEAQPDLLPAAPIHQKGEPKQPLFDPIDAALKDLNLTSPSQPTPGRPRAR